MNDDEAKHRVLRSAKMTIIRTLALLGTAALGACVAPGPMPGPGFGGNFADFGQDENTCRKVGAAAIQSGDQQASPDKAAANASYRYDTAYRNCMVGKGQARRMGSLDGDGQADPPYRRSNPHSFDFPDAYYSIPYATPGYGYDGFSEY